MVSTPAVPVIDLSTRDAGSKSPSVGSDSVGSDSVGSDVVDRVALAAAEYGFFQIINHGISDDLIARVWDRTAAFFALPIEEKRRLLRTKENSRGYYDRELTKNARDLKEVLDLAHVPFPELADDDRRNHHAVDGYNQWPELVDFRSTLVEYLAACEALSVRLLSAFAMGLGESRDRLQGYFGSDHTSFVRLNYYPLADPLTAPEAADVTPLGDMALHHHSDAGALTLLLQDEVGGLQVLHGESWVDVEPIPGALVVNTGDMMQVWSNDRYRAALHRVSPRTDRARYSLPYFFNPSYSTDYQPLPGTVSDENQPRYRRINWGSFRQARADGDFADYGAEVQISDFHIRPESG